VAPIFGTPAVQNNPDEAQTEDTLLYPMAEKLNKT
jgi:hypothetical protein